MDKSQLEQARGFIYTDIQREIELARATGQKPKLLEEAGVTLGGGNFICALALFCYIEFAGKLRYAYKKNNGDDHASRNFNAFFDDLGLSYRDFRDSFSDKNFVYDNFRCGLAHEYYVKNGCNVFMFKEASLSVAGVGATKAGQYFIIVEVLFKDFCNAFDQL